MKQHTGQTAMHKQYAEDESNNTILQSYPPLDRDRDCHRDIDMRGNRPCL